MSTSSCDWPDTCIGRTVEGLLIFDKQKRIRSLPMSQKCQLQTSTLDTVLRQYRAWHGQMTPACKAHVGRWVFKETGFDFAVRKLAPGPVLEKKTAPCSMGQKAAKASILASDLNGHRGCKRDQRAKK